MVLDVGVMTISASHHPPPPSPLQVTAPLSKTDEIVMIGGEDRTTSEVSRLLGGLPPAVAALTGVDLSKVISQIPGAAPVAQA